MKFDELQHMMQKPEVQPDTYEAGMALNQLLKIGKHAIKLHNMIDNDAEMESWVAKKIDLAGDYVKKVHGYMEGEKAGLYDDGGMTEDKHCGPGEYYCRMSGKCKPIPAGHTVDKDGTLVKEDASGFKLVSQAKDIAKKMAGNYSGAVRQIEKLQKDLSKNTSVKQALLQFNEDAGEKIANMAQNMTRDEFMSHADELGLTPEEAAEYYKKMQGGAYAGKFEDAGEGHMSKSTLYHTAKYAIELMQIINKGDDLEGWVQSKLNKAADYLQGAYNYEEYQKLNPYREELDPALMQKHGQVIQKNIDEILARETKIEDVDTKPGMMRILAKRVNEVEKEIAKENRKETNESGILYRAGVKKYGKAGMKAIQSAAGKGASHQEIGKIKDKHLNDAEDLEEGIKEWGQRLAMAGIIVAGLAGVNSINNAIDNSVPAVKAMNTALELAQDNGNTELAKMIEKDLSDAKVRLSTGKDLGSVASLQDKYAKFMKTEGLAYESKLMVNLKQRLK